MGSFLLGYHYTHFFKFNKIQTKNIGELKSNNRWSLHLIEGVNHSLEFEESIDHSIDVLKENMIVEF